VELTFLFVPTPDLAAGAGFYRDVLGLEEAWRDGDVTVAFWSPDRKVQLMVSTTEQPAGPMYLVEDLAQWVAVHGGLPMPVPTRPIPYGSVAGFADPAGNVFYVFDQPGRPPAR
jgi:predicted enzyme related to lactoylglutathione lyase